MGSPFQPLTDMDMAIELELRQVADDLAEAAEAVGALEKRRTASAVRARLAGWTTVAIAEALDVSQPMVSKMTAPDHLQTAFGIPADEVVALQSQIEIRAGIKARTEAEERKAKTGVSDHIDQIREIAEQRKKRKTAEDAEPPMSSLDADADDRLALAKPRAVKAHLEILELARYQLEQAQEVLECRIALTRYMGATFKEISQAASVTTTTIGEAISKWEESDQTMVEWLIENHAYTAWEQSGKDIDEWLMAKAGKGIRDTKSGIGKQVGDGQAKSHRYSDEMLEPLAVEFVKTKQGEPFTSLEFAKWLDATDYTGRSDQSRIKRALLNSGCSYKPVVGKEGKRKRMYLPPDASPLP